MKFTSGIVALMLFGGIYSGLSYAQTDTSKKAGSTNQTKYSPNDVLAQTTKGTNLADIFDDPENKKAVALFDEFISTQSNGYDLLHTFLSLNNPALLADNDDVMIIHAVSWKTISSVSGDKTTVTYQPMKGAWAFCRNRNKGKDAETEHYCHQDHDLSGTPYMYNAPHVYLIDLNYFPDAIGGTKGTFTYETTTTPRQKQNATSIATLISAVLKLPSVQVLGKTEGAPNTTPTPVAQVWGTVTTIKASSPLPYDLAISSTFTANPTNKDDVSCGKSTCSFSKTVAHYDPEYWDVSIGVSTLGVLEPKYSSTGALATPTRHTDAYAFLDIYPFQPLAEAPTNLTRYPHFNLGLPISGQSLHRPYVGLAENFGFLTKRVKQARRDTTRTIRKGWQASFTFRLTPPVISRRNSGRSPIRCWTRR
ncbi:MAG: hypothetical protein WBF04_00930 [Candidatus Sulfotelmatobacter sp.]